MAYPAASAGAQSWMVQRAGTLSRQPLASTNTTPPRNPPYQTSPPREKSAAGSPVSTVYHTLAPTTPPTSAAMTMSEA